MIVSALVLTSRDSLASLTRRFESDCRIQTGTSNGAFLPIVATTADLREARKLYEQLSAQDGVDDIQLVSWTSDELELENELASKEPTVSEGTT